jgi:serine/threonine-protein kinase
VPPLTGKTEAEAKKALEDAGCKLGDVKPGPDNPDQAGKITEQGTPADTLVPTGTTVNVTVAGPVCNIANLVGMTEQQARDSVTAQGCTLQATPKHTDNASEVGKVTTQNPDANSLVPKNSVVNVTLGVQVLGASLERGAPTDVSGTPQLVRTGGVALGGLALWLLISGLMTSAASSERLWRLVRRTKA